MKHSPGPWRVVEDPEEWWIVKDPRNRCIAECTGSREYRSIREADARLIAAAPELLRLALYAHERGEGDAEMAREILMRLGLAKRDEGGVVVLVDAP